MFARHDEIESENLTFCYISVDIQTKRKPLVELDAGKQNTKIVALVIHKTIGRNIT